MVEKIDASTVLHFSFPREEQIHFYIFRYLEDNIHIYFSLIDHKPGVSKLKPMSQSGLLPVFINKILLEHSHVYSFTYHLWLLPSYDSRIE